MTIDPDVQARLDVLIAQAETKGCVNLSELSREAGLDDEQSHEVHERLERDAVRRAVAQLPDRQREVVRMRYGIDGGAPSASARRAARSASQPSGCARSRTTRCGGWPRCASCRASAQRPSSSMVEDDGAGAGARVGARRFACNGARTPTSGAMG